MDQTAKKYAVLIDGDNIATKYIGDVINELSSYGTLTIKRVYGDFKNPKLKEWEKTSLKYSIIPVQQYENTKGKNSTDMVMAIDAMDILHQGEVNGFCIISSDSDFTRLAARLRESGSEVIGMGNRNTVPAFMAACSTFKKLENLGEKEEEELLDMSVIKKEITDILFENEDDMMYTSQLRDTLVRRNPGFDIKDYGFSKFSAFLSSMDNLALYERGNKVGTKGSSGVEIRDMVQTIVRSGTYTTNELNGMIKKRYPEFNLRSMGFASWRSFINSMGMWIDSHQHVKCKTR